MMHVTNVKYAILTASLKYLQQLLIRSQSGQREVTKRTLFLKPSLFH